MARVVLSGSLSQYTNGETELDLEASNVHQLFEFLGRRFPDLRPQLEANLAVAIDGEIYQDALLEPIPPGAEVHVLPRIAGG